MSNTLLLVASVLIFLTGITHSILGERLIFRHLGQQGHWIDTGLSGLRVRQIRALWSTWHLLSLFGFCIALLLMIESQGINQNTLDIRSFSIQTISLTFGVATPFWLMGTKGKHPAWIVFLAISLLTWFSR